MNDFTNRNKFGNPNDEFLFGTGLFGLAGVYCITINLHCVLNTYNRHYNYNKLIIFE